LFFATFMKFASLLMWVFSTLFAFELNTKAASSDNAFDGSWSVTVDFHAYRNPDGTVTKPWIRHFQVNVKNGILQGEQGTKGAPAWYELSGKIGLDGTANLLANGITGKADYTPTHPEPGHQFQYQVIARFSSRRGTGHSVGNPPPPLAPRTRIYAFVKNGG
jgi:hypothetical protein